MRAGSLRRRRSLVGGVKKDSTRRALVFMAAAAVWGGLGMPSARNVVPHRVGWRHVTGLGSEPREHHEGGDDGWMEMGCSRESEGKNRRRWSSELPPCLNKWFTALLSAQSV